jgi:hypothetical protein
MNDMNILNKLIVALALCLSSFLSWAGNGKVTVLTIGNPPIMSRTAGYHNGCEVEDSSAGALSMGNQWLEFRFRDPATCPKDAALYRFEFLPVDVGWATYIGCEFDHFEITDTHLRVNIFVYPNNTTSCKFKLERKTGGQTYRRITRLDNNFFYTSNSCLPVEAGNCMDGPATLEEATDLTKMYCGDVNLSMHRIRTIRRNEPNGWYRDPTPMQAVRFPSPWGYLYQWYTAVDWYSPQPWEVQLPDDQSTIPNIYLDDLENLGQAPLWLRDSYMDGDTRKTDQEIVALIKQRSPLGLGSVLYDGSFSPIATSITLPGPIIGEICRWSGDPPRGLPYKNPPGQ